MDKAEVTSVPTAKFIRGITPPLARYPGFIPKGIVFPKNLEVFAKKLLKNVPPKRPKKASVIKNVSPKDSKNEKSFLDSLRSLKADNIIAIAEAMITPP